MIEMLLSAGGVMFTTSSYTRIVNPGSGTLTPPPGAKAMRVAAIGGGGGAAICKPSTVSRRTMGGSGGGCAATIIVPAAPIEFEVGAGGAGIFYSTASVTAPAENGGDTIATFLNYTLIGRGGRGGSVNSNSDLTYSGGVGEGGDYSFQGGSASRGYRSNSTHNVASTGGGGAGPNGNGANGARSNTESSIRTATQGSFSNTGWGDGGGASGVTSGRRGGGAGMGQFDGDEAALGTSVFGRSDGSMGGGGSAHGNLSSALSSWCSGGPGGLVVEWFF